MQDLGSDPISEHVLRPLPCPTAEEKQPRFPTQLVPEPPLVASGVEPNNVHLEGELMSDMHDG